MEIVLVHFKDCSPHFGQNCLLVAMVQAPWLAPTALWIFLSISD
ncbi:hypothetical protein CE91St39_29540 [Desulfovibrionaceae bacterium]|nr:hypothetical protein CE91St39_29540 [Desulfovibrionaceae bacterium]